MENKLEKLICKVEYILEDRREVGEINFIINKNKFEFGGFENENFNNLIIFVIEFLENLGGEKIKLIL